MWKKDKTKGLHVSLRREVANRAEGWLADGRSRSKCSTLVGRSFDLKSAYRQLAVSDSSLKWARLAVYCPEEKATKCFQQYSLPFGAKSSVVAFLRCARMLPEAKLGDFVLLRRLYMLVHPSLEQKQ